MGVGCKKDSVGFGLGMTLGLLCWISPLLAAPAAVDIGSKLDQAAMACRQGDAQQLTLLSNEIRTLIAQKDSLKKQQDYIEKLLTLFANGICNPEDPTTITRLDAVSEQKSTQLTQLQVATGYLDNVNQGSRHELISLTDPFTGAQVQGRLDASYLPLSSAFIGVQAVHREVKNNGKTVDSATFVHQSYTDQSDFSTTGVALNRQQQLKTKQIASTAIEYISDAKGNSRATLNGNLYQPWVATPTQKIGVNVGAEYARYPHQAAYDSLTVNTSLEQRKLLNNKGAEWAARARLEYDHALRERPGGDRTEVELAAQWKGSLSTQNWQPSIGLKAAYKVDAKVFDQALFGDSKRKQLRTSLDIGTSKKLAKGRKLYLNYQRSRTQDREIDLFDQPVGNAVSVGLETSF